MNSVIHQLKPIEAIYRMLSYFSQKCSEAAAKEPPDRRCPCKEFFRSGGPLAAAHALQKVFAINLAH